MKRVILESPYAGDVERNVKYARMCVKDSLMRGEAPIASHLLYTQEGILDDTVPEERGLGIDAGLAWKGVAELHVFYVDYGVTKGMEYAHKYATENGIKTEHRYILKDSVMSDCPFDMKNVVMVTVFVNQLNHSVMKKGKFIKEIMYLGAAEDRAVSEQNSKMMKKEAKKLFKSYISSAVEKGVLSYLNDIGSQLEESYGDKLVILEGKDFKPFSKAIIKNILNDENKHKSSN